MDAHVLWLCSLLARVLQQLSVGMLLVSIWVFSVIVVDGITLLQTRRLWKRRPAMKALALAADLHLQRLQVASDAAEVNQ
jgi:hypothetical protein